MDPFSVLPDEILEAFLERLQTPEDFASCSRAYKGFYRILHPTKTTWVFHEVFTVIFPYLCKTDVLTCRQICSTWRSAVDTYLEFLVTTSITRSSPVAENSISQWFIWPKTSSMIMDIVNQPSSHPNYPFFARCLRLGKDYDSHIGEIHDYWSSVQLLLARFGSHIRDCRFSFEETSINFMFILRGCLNHLPNVQSLQISNVDTSYGGGSNRRYPDLLQSLQSKPFRPLAHLTRLNLVNPPTLFFDHVFPIYADNLQVFNLCNLQLSNWMHPDVIETIQPIPNATTVCITVNREHLISFPTSVPKLTKLVLSCPQICNGESVGRLLRVCQQSLEELTLLQNFNQGETIGELFTTSFPYEMPRLKEISIVNPTQDCIENLIHSKKICANINKLYVQWRTDNFMYLLKPGELLSPDELPVADFLNFCRKHDSRWAQVYDFFQYIRYRRDIWERLVLLEACYLSGSCESTNKTVFDIVIRREMISHDAYCVK